ncbi:MAG: HAD-IIIC family phosphatase [Chthoniobacterales bacterium]
MKYPEKVHYDFQYRAPIDLGSDEVECKNILMIGSCLSNVLLLSFKNFLSTQARAPNIDHILINNVAPLPSSPPRPIEDYSFQIIQLPLRGIMPESLYFSLAYQESQAYKNAFEKSLQLLELFLDQALDYHKKYSLTTFVTNFLVPQQNSMGRLFPKYDLRNMAYFVEELNRHLSETIFKKNNIYLTDINEIATTFGRRYIQDDVLHTSNHGSIATDFDFAFDLRRLEKPIRFSKQHLLNTHGFIDAITHEIITQYKIVAGHNSIKIVICDLDDTLWRGVLAEDGIHLVELEGWPLGLLEALLVLKKRGILLAIASKNEESLIIQQWDKVFKGHLKLEDFAIRKINWKEKAENIAAILKEVNLLPRHALFIDDNPVEREQVQRTFPEIRTLGANLYSIRKILLWAPELQIAHITEESSRRTELVQAQSARQELSKKMSREEFLASLELKIEPFKINVIDHSDFARALELLNKTNQFNTTGQQWRVQECDAFFKQQGLFYAFKVSDKFTPYGLVGLVVVQGNHLVQVVMSCRVVGLDIEKAMLAHVIMQATAPIITADFRETESNFLCREFLADFGFSKKENVWRYKRTHLNFMPKN